MLLAQVSATCISAVLLVTHVAFVSHAARVDVQLQDGDPCVPPIDVELDHRGFADLSLRGRVYIVNRYAKPVYVTVRGNFMEAKFTTTDIQLGVDRDILEKTEAANSDLIQEVTHPWSAIAGLLKNPPMRQLEGDVVCPMAQALVLRGTRDHKFKAYTDGSEIGSGRRFLCGDADTLGIGNGGPFICQITVLGLCLCIDSSNERTWQAFQSSLAFEGYLQLRSVFGRVCSHAVQGTAVQAVSAAEFMANPMFWSKLATGAVGAGIMGPFQLATAPYQAILGWNDRMVEEHIYRIARATRLQATYVFGWIIPYLFYSEMGLTNREFPDSSCIASSGSQEMRTLLRCFCELYHQYEPSAEVTPQLVQFARDTYGFMPVAGSTAKELAVGDALSKALRFAPGAGPNVRFAAMSKVDDRAKDSGDARLRLSLTQMNAVLPVLATELARIDVAASERVMSNIKKHLDTTVYQFRRNKIGGVLDLIGITPEVDPIQDDSQILTAYQYLPIDIQGFCGDAPPGISTLQDLKSEAAKQGLAAEIAERVKSYEEPRRHLERQSHIDAH